MSIVLSRIRHSQASQVGSFRQIDSKSEKVYHLVGKHLKLLFWDRMQKNMVLKMSFEKKSNRVASGGAAWDPITLLAKGHIGITRY